MAYATSHRLRMEVDPRIPVHLRASHRRVSEGLGSPRPHARAIPPTPCSAPPRLRPMKSRFSGGSSDRAISLPHERMVVRIELKGCLGGCAHARAHACFKHTLALVLEFRGLVRLHVRRLVVEPVVHKVKVLSVRARTPRSAHTNLLRTGLVIRCAGVLAVGPDRSTKTRQLPRRLDEALLLDLSRVQSCRDRVEGRCLGYRSGASARGKRERAGDVILEAREKQRSGVRLLLRRETRRRAGIVKLTEIAERLLEDGPCQDRVASRSSLDLVRKVLPTERTVGGRGSVR